MVDREVQAFLGTPTRKARLLGRHPWLGHSRLLRQAHDRLRRPVLVLAYHRILPAVDPKRFPLDLGLVSTTPEEFDWQMAHVRAEFDPVSLEEITRFIEGRGELPPRPVAVTFDDGYEDNYRHAFPVLARHRIPATIFLTAGAIDEAGHLWHDVAACAVLKSRRPLVLDLGSERLEIGPDASVYERRQGVKRLLKHLKTLPHTQLQSTIGHLRQEHGDAIRAEDLDAARLLSWQQVREMSQGGVFFGSHTMSHALLSRLTGDELDFELRDSRALIERHAGSPCDTLAYPVGRAFAVNAIAVERIRAAGYRLGLAYDPGPNWAGSLDRYGIRRQSVEMHTSRVYFTALLNLPDWFQ